MKKYLPIITALLTLTTFLSGFSFPVLAQEVAAPQVAIVVSPPRFDLDMKPGETVQKTVKVMNNDTEKELILKVFKADFIVQDDQGTPIKVDTQASGRFLASPWFTTESDEIIVAPGEQKSVSVLITAPTDALPGGHYAGVFFEPVVARGLKTNISYTAAQVGSLFAITIAGDIKYDALIKEFVTSLPMYEFGPIDFTATIENQSDTHIHPQTSIAITDMLGRQVASFPLDEVNIFPFTSRTIKGDWDITWGLGRYTAVLTATYGPGITTERSLMFWIMPWKVIAAILVLLAVLLVVVISIRRHLQHRSDSRDSEIDELKRKIVELENRQ